jgi:hypothetical protein
MCGECASFGFLQTIANADPTSSTTSSIIPFAKHVYSVNHEGRKAADVDTAMTYLHELAAISYAARILQREST